MMSDDKTEKIRIAFCIAALVSGGAENQLIQLISGLSKSKFEVILYAFSDGIWRSRFERAGAKIFLLNSGGFKFFSLFYAIRQMYFDRPQLLHCFGVSANKFGRLAGILALIPIVIAGERSNPNKTLSLKTMLFYRLLAPFTNAVIANSRTGVDFWVKKKLQSPECSFFIQNCITIDHGLVRRIKKCELKCLSIGDLRPEKNHRFLIEVMALVVDAMPQATLKICGDGELRSSLSDLCEARGVSENVIFLGYHENPTEEILQADVYVHAAVLEGSPNAVYEAMYCGLPCVVTTSSGCNDFIQNGKNGFITSATNPSEMAQVIIDLFNSNTFIQRVSKNAFQSAQTFPSRLSFCEEHVSIYLDLLKNK